MEKTNTPQYKTQYVNHFRDFDANKEKEELKKLKRSFNKNEDDIYELPNTNKPHFNNVSKKMQFLSKDEIKDKIEAIEDMEDKKESKIFNWTKFNEMHSDDSNAFKQADYCEGCGENIDDCTCEKCEGCGEDEENCTCNHE
jgi:hypothetical protein